jgi:chromosome segregation ATPase
MEADRREEQDRFYAKMAHFTQDVGALRVERDAVCKDLNLLRQHWESLAAQQQQLDLAHAEDKRLLEGTIARLEQALEAALQGQQHHQDTRTDVEHRLAEEQARAAAQQQQLDLAHAEEKRLLDGIIAHLQKDLEAALQGQQHHQDTRTDVEHRLAEEQARAAVQQQQLDLAHGEDKRLLEGKIARLEQGLEAARQGQQHHQDACMDVENRLAEEKTRAAAERHKWEEKLKATQHQADLFRAELELEIQRLGRELSARNREREAALRQLQEMSQETDRNPDIQEMEQQLQAEKARLNRALQEALRQHEATAKKNAELATSIQIGQAALEQQSTRLAALQSELTAALQGQQQYRNVLQDTERRLAEVGPRAAAVIRSLEEQLHASRQQCDRDRQAYQQEIDRLRGTPSHAVSQHWGAAVDSIFAEAEEHRARG